MQNKFMKDGLPGEPWNRSSTPGFSALGCARSTGFPGLCQTLEMPKMNQATSAVEGLVVSWGDRHVIGPF